MENNNLTRNDAEPTEVPRSEIQSDPRPAVLHKGQYVGVKEATAAILL